MIVLIVGDIVGRPGRRALSETLPGLVEEFSPDFVIANGENAAGGSGITRETAAPLFSAGVHVLTMGNHVWNHREAIPYIEEDTRIVRPANFPSGSPGRGANVFVARDGVKVAVINLQGRTFMQPIDDPFRTGSQLIETLSQQADVIIVDFHAEATSEKMAFAHYVDGGVACVYGTHTHVATADEGVLPRGTAYITDIGMTGPSQSIIGMRPDEIIERFVTGLPKRYEVAGGPTMLNGIVLDIDESKGLARSIQRVRRDGS
ncbi:MAG: TIGR00282 family metallophosphoesterase [Armatimonadetes bacterium]|nr:TIGR00282 family metallophosphoesterase [Armatimonadota bacterium]